MKYMPLLVIILIISCTSTEQKERDKHMYPAEYLYKQRQYPVGIKNDIFQKGFKYVQALKKGNYSHYRNDWLQEGPLNVPGRIVDIEGTGAADNRIYVCTASGGIFVTENEGQTWNPIFDDQVTLSIGDMDIAPSDKNIIYVGTGEANAGGGSLAYDGFGVFRSSDGGSTWENRGLFDVGSIGKVAIHPTNPDIVYVAAMGTLFSPNEERGIYKTIDGGLTWENVLFISNITGGIDLALDPTNPETVYAAMWERERTPETRDYGGPTSGIYKTTNGGAEWIELENGIPGTDKGRIGLAIAESNPNILYTTIASPNGSLMGIYKTNDAGSTWEQKSNDNVSSVPFMWWFGKMEVHPNNPDLVYHIGFFTNKSTNGANSWEEELSSMHVDQHAVWMNPENENEAWFGNDGGAYLTTNGGISFTSFNMPTTQFYTCEIDYLAPSNLYGGSQDNGTNRTLTGAEDDYMRIFGGDGFRVLVDYSDNDIIFVESQRGNLAKSTDGGFSFSSSKEGIGSEPSNWNTPIAMHPTDPNIMYFGSSILYRSTDKGDNWTPISNDLSDGPYFGINNYGTITAIETSFNDKVLAGTDDGNVWLKDDLGDLSLVYDSSPRRWITSVSFDPEDDNILYVTFSGYRYSSTDSQVIMSTDNGITWTNINGDLPDIPINDLIIRPDAEEILIATDIGVFSTQNGGLNWLPIGTGLPNVVVTDIDYHEPSRKLLAATYGRSFFSIILDENVSVYHIGNEIKVFPNPTSQYLSVEIDEYIEKFEILNLNGQVVKTGFYSNEDINIMDLSAGHYLIKLSNNENKTYRTKFVVVK